MTNDSSIESKSAFSWRKYWRRTLAFDTVGSILMTLAVCFCTRLVVGWIVDLVPVLAGLSAWIYYVPFGLLALVTFVVSFLVLLAGIVFLAAVICGVHFLQARDRRHNPEAYRDSDDSAPVERQVTASLDDGTPKRNGSRRGAFGLPEASVHQPSRRDNGGS